MLLNFGKAIGILVVVYGILCLITFLRRKKPAPPIADEALTPEVPEAAAPALPIFPFENTHEVPIPGSDLCYCRPFGPSDSIADVWCKLQTFTSTDPIVVRLGTPEAPPLFKSSFSPDGAVHSTGAMFADEFAGGILRHSWSSICRQIRALSSFGVPAEVPEGTHQIYTGPLFIELKGIRLMDETFLIRATFQPNLGLIKKHFSGDARYLCCPVRPDGSSEMTVGFPWTLTRLTLNSDDRPRTSATPEFVTSLQERYAKYRRHDSAAKPVDEQSAETDALFSDGIIVISISALTARGSHDSRYVQVTYSPMPNGSLDSLATADEEFRQFAAAIAERQPALNTV